MPPPTEPPESCSAELRRRTRPAHRFTEQARFLRAFLRGTVDLPSYIGLLRRLHGLYSTLEDALRLHRDHPAVGPFFWPELLRTESLAADLAALGQPVQAPFLSPALDRYRLRLADLSRLDPPLLAAHAYVRYLGDLSGGRILHQLAVRSLQLTPGLSDRFYLFPGLPDLDAAKADFRRRLDAWGEALPQRREDLVTEAIDAFHLNRGLFDELASAPWMRLWAAFRPRLSGPTGGDGAVQPS